ncbi:MAG: Bax inhibitor-1/YccA family protein [Candidatus Kapabacteria bacterium]|nr:Bax inhibitor-1/YccA family protein [Candidatus Kapabacteria bacterium]
MNNDGAALDIQRTFLQKVYAWMFGGLLTTAVVAFAVVSSSVGYGLLSYRWIFALANIGLVWYLSARINSLSSTAATVLFLVYSALSGVTFSIIFFVYTLDSIMSTFLVAAGMFAAMSAYGYFTKRDLSGWGSFLMMGVIGIILASVVNWFLGSSALSFAVSLIGVFVFVGLTAYDTQKIKEMAVVETSGSELASKAAIIGALELYLDFINLFLFLLRLLGGRRN